MGALLKVIDAALVRRGWPHEQMPERDVITFPFQGDDELWAVYAEAREEDGRVIVYSVVPFNIPLQRRAAVAEFLTRANYGLQIGNFELDLDDGEVRCKTSVDVKGVKVAPELVDRLIVMNLQATNRYVGGIAALVGDDDAVPAQLIDAIEASD